jgi:DNA polymerase III subunit epsilon
MSDGLWPGRASIRVAVLDSETTGLDPEVDELVGLAVVFVEVSCPDGALLRVEDRYSGLREPAHISIAAQACTGLDLPTLRGQVLDEAGLRTKFSNCDLAVAHNAELERSFLLPLFPRLAFKPWACALTGIAWVGREGLQDASIVNLLAAYGLGPSDGTPAQETEGLVRVLARVLPRSARTGFAALMSQAATPLSVHADQRA